MTNDKPCESQIDLEKLYRALCAFAGRVEKLSDPAVAEAGKRLKAEVREAKKAS